MLEILPIGKYIFWILYWILFPVIFTVQIASATETDLYSAIWKKETLRVKILCSVKWIKFCNRQGHQSLLNFSIRSNSKELVSFFLDRDFPVDQKNHSGKTALHIASEKGFCEIAELLIQKGASVNAFEHKKDEKWPMLTPLHYAAWKGNTCIIKKLINNGAGLSFLSESGFTPLHSAASAGKKSAAEVLLSAGADLMIEDGSGRLPFQTAFEYDRFETGIFLLEKTLEKNRCSLNFFRNGLCLPGRFTGKTRRHLTSGDKTGRYSEQKNTQK